MTSFSCFWPLVNGVLIDLYVRDFFFSFSVPSLFLVSVHISKAMVMMSVCVDAGGFWVTLYFFLGGVPLQFVVLTMLGCWVSAHACFCRGVCSALRVGVGAPQV